MKSYASIDRLESNFAVCEVELLPMEESRPEDFASKFTVMLDVSLKELYNSVKDVNEGDILIVEHDGDEIEFIYCKDDIEKQSRIAVLEAMM